MKDGTARRPPRQEGQRHANNNEPVELVNISTHLEQGRCCELSGFERFG